MTSAFSWQNCEHFPCFILYSKAKLARYSRYLLISYFCIPVPSDEKGICFLDLLLEGLVSLHRTLQLQLLKHYWSGHRLGLVWYWMVCLENEQKSFCHFEIAPKYCISDSFVDYESYSISSKGFLPTVEDIMIWVKFTLPIHFSSLIPKMSMFILAISCLTTSNLLWFMGLTFQVPMQYCSLQHQILLPLPVTSTTVCCFALPPSLHSFRSYFSIDL